jgi:hypothetical protein
MVLDTLANASLRESRDPARFECHRRYGVRLPDGFFPVLRPRDVRRAARRPQGRRQGCAAA